MLFTIPSPKCRCILPYTQPDNIIKSKPKYSENQCHYNPRGPNKHIDTSGCSDCNLVSWFSAMSGFINHLD